MPEPLEVLAARARDEPFFLAWVLAAYAGSEQLDDAALAGALGCTTKDLPMIRLCRAPRSDPEGFRADIDRISERFRLDPLRLADVVKRGRVVARLQAKPEQAKQETEHGYLMAARDREPDPPEGAS
jgi:hypothetical protein